MRHTSCAGLPAASHLLPSHAAAPGKLSAVSRPISSQHGRQRRTLHVHASLGVPEPFAAPLPLQQPSLSSTADVQRQLDAQFDSMMSPFSSMRQIESRMEQQFREMDRQFDRAFEDMDRVQRQMDAELARSMRQLQQQEPGVRIERREERAPGAYRYYESIQIRSGSSMAVLTPAHTAAPMFSPLLLAAVVLAGAYAAITTAFNRNYELTTYKQQGKWQLVLLWPVLALFSRGFRQQFSSALRGEKVKVLQSMEEQQAGNTIDSS